MSSLSHLFICEAEVAPGSEWKDSLCGWKIILIGKGVLYWISRSEIHELNSGDVLVVGPSVEGVLRGSRIGPSLIHFFCFRPEHLAGLLSLSDRVSLETFAEATQKQIIPATHVVAKEYAEIVRSSSRRRSFFYRCQLVRLIAMVFSEALPGGPTSHHQPMAAIARFEDLMARIPEVDLINYSPEKLAEMCGCSLRHFRRMFRKQFKTSVRAKQTALRLEKACQTLAETEERILTIAVESGYRHIGFFNAIFKKHFGVTPSQWRRMSTGPGRQD